MSSTAPAIEVLDLHKGFNGALVLQGITLEIRRGEVLVILGRSGTGKSVFLKHLIGLLAPDSGRVVVGGQDLVTLDEQALNLTRRRFGMLFQNAALFDSLTVWQNVGFALSRHTRLSPEEIRQIASKKLAMVGLTGVEDAMPAELSGGMKKRVALARAIVMEPEILLYDEPTTGLDPIMADVITDLILEMKQRLAVTSVVITHDLVATFKIADRVAMLHEGKILEVAEPHEFQATTNPIVRQFLMGKALPVE